MSIVDTFWQTETGGHVITPLPGATSTKPGSAVSALVFFSDGHARPLYFTHNLLNNRYKTLDNNDLVIFQLI